MSEELSKEEIQKRIQLMKDNCIFCKIIDKKIPGKIVFEDDICLAALDINPATTGHILLMPKEHYMMMPMVPDEVLGHLMAISKSLSVLLEETFNSKNTTVFIANGRAAGQMSQHFMVHVIPRYEDDGINFNLEGKSLDDEKILELKEKLKERLNNFS